MSNMLIALAGAPEIFVLRRKSDGVLMPDFNGRAGGSHVDPDDPQTHAGIPRVFKTRKAAENCLIWWSRGKVKMGVETFDVGSLDPFTESVIKGQETVTGRNAADWEVLPVTFGTKP